jgi:DNA helicase-2/ATP-dependent DNA helicase PcrA
VSISTDYRLSAGQVAAVESDDRAIVVVASAGCGKTEVVARRVERLLRESPADMFRVLALSYTVKAADELTERLRDRLGDLHRRVDANTIHGFAHSLLRQHGTRIGLPLEPEVLVRDADRAELLSRWLAAEGKPVPDDLPAVLREIDLAQARQEPVPMLGEWRSALASVDALDYGSMLDRACELLSLPSTQRQLGRLYGHVIIDEAQNLTNQQYALLTALVSADGGGTPAPSIPTMLVGDDKQSIVSFAGADPTLIGRFESAYAATRFELAENFRSAASIVRLERFVASDLGRTVHAGDADARYPAQGQIEFRELPNEEAEGTFVASWVVGLLERGVPPSALAPGESGHLRPEDIAVLARSAAALRPVREALELTGQTPALASLPEDWLATLPGKVAYEIVALHSAADHQSTHWELARLLSVDERCVSGLRQLADALRDHPDDNLRWLVPLCEVSQPQEFMDRLALIELSRAAKAEALADWEGDIRTLLDAWRSFRRETRAVEQTWGNFRLHVARIQRGDDLAPGIRLLTIHKAQGREYRAVAIVGLNDGQIPDFRARSREEQIAELRTFYVATTRARRMLLLTRSKARQTRYGPRVSEPSRYLKYVDRAS